MANKKINELVTRTPSLSDLILVGDPSSGYSYKATVTALATIIETDIADGFVTLSTTQTISGAKTFSNNLTLTSVANAAITQTKFLTLNASNVVNYRTGAEVLADIGGQAALTNPITGTGTTNYLPKFTGSTTIGNSQLIDNGTTVFLGTSGTLPNVKMIISTTSQRALELNSTSGNALFVSSGGAFVMTVTNGTWSSQFTQAGRLELGGDLSITTIANATVDTDKFLVSDSGVIKYRTGAEVLSDIGGASSSSISGTTNYIPKFTSSSAIGNSVIYDNSGQILIGTTSSVSGAKLEVNHNDASIITVTRNGGSNSNTAIEFKNATLSVYMGSNGSVFGVGGTTGSIAAQPFIIEPQASEQMRLTSTGLGIGTSSPAAKLDVAGSSAELIRLSSTATNGSYLGFRNSGTLNGAIGNGSNLISTITNSDLGLWTTGVIAFQTNGSERMRIDASGNLGLGVTPSAWARGKALEIGTIGNAIWGDVSNEITTITSNAYLNTTDLTTGWAYGITAASARYDLIAGVHKWFIAPSGTAGNAITFTQAMTLDASGNLLVGGTSSNGLRLQVTGDIYASNEMYLDNGKYLRLQRSSGGLSIQTLGIPSGTDNVRLLTTGSFDIVNGSLINLVKVTNDGNLGLGVTPSAWSVGKAIEVGSLGNALWTTGANGMNLISNGYYDGSYKYAGTGFATMYANGAASGNHQWFTAPSGTAGNAISFTQAMTLDASGRLAIGTTSPSGKLHIAATTGVATPGSIALAIRDAGNSGFGFDFNLEGVATGDLSLMRTESNTQSQVMTFKRSNGNVGVGTTSPSEKLDLQGTMNINGASGTYLQIQYNGANRGYLGTANATIASGSTGDLGLSATSNLVFGTGGSLTERMRITSAGLVGIGTSTFNYTSATRGQLALNGATDVVMDFQVGTTSYGYIYAASTGFEMTNPTNNPLKFITNNVERMRITSGGDVGIGSTNADPLSLGRERNLAIVTTGTNAALTVVGGSASRIDFGVGTTRTAGIYSDVSNFTEIFTSTSLPLVFSTNGAQRMRITSSGELLINTTSDAGDYKLQVNGAGYFIYTGGVPSINLRASDTNFALMSILGNQTGDVNWLLMSGYPNAGDFTIRQSDVINALTIAKTTGNAIFSGSIKTAAPSGGTAKPFKIGAAAVVSPTSPNRTIEIEIDGTTYYLSAKTTNN